MKLVERKITIVLNKEEEKAFQTVHEILARVCYRMTDCDQCPLCSMCGKTFDAKNDIETILNSCEIEGE